MEYERTCLYCKYQYTDVDQEPCCKCEKNATDKFVDVQMIDKLRYADVETLAKYIYAARKMKLKEIEEWLETKLWIDSDVKE